MSHLIAQFSGMGVAVLHVPADEAAPWLGQWAAGQAPDDYVKAGRRSRVVALLPKSLYLIRTLELPAVAPAELKSMLRLELEASLPLEMGDFDFAYRPLSAPQEDLGRYEVYVCRRSDLEQYVDRLKAAGVAPEVVAPSGVVWAHFLQEQAHGHIGCAWLTSGELEMASLGPGQAVNIRSCAVASDGATAEMKDACLLSHLRPLLADPMRSDGACRILWVGHGCPTSMGNGGLTFEDQTQRFVAAQTHAEGIEPSCCTLMFLAAAALRGGHDDAVWQTANLLPHRLVVQRERSVFWKKAGTAAACLVMAFVLIYAGLAVLNYRYQQRARDLAGQIAQIKTRAERTGQRLEQLEAVAAARRTRNVFLDVIEALHACTPEGVTYGHVELREDGTVRLRGQAESLALPFQLPERLEEQAVFSQVLPADASQSRVAGGAVTEFQIVGKFVQPKP